jgi:hydrogenase/urease accessory protein HupE
MQESAGKGPRQLRRSWIAFLVGLGLIAAGLLATGAFPVLSTVAAIVGIAAMIYGLAAGVMVVLNRDADGSPD